MFLEKDTFSSIIKNAPLISIDLIVRNESSEVLLGKRVNKPAKDFWFEPGGRILKDESIDEAFKRITEAELGEPYSKNNSNFLGVYQHFYDDNVFGNDFTTHYIVLVFELKITQELSPQKEQHSHYKWFSEDELMGSDDVHKYVKEYFTPTEGIK